MLVKFLSIFCFLYMHLFALLSAQDAIVAPISPLSTQDIWKRPVVIGASLSDGYHHTEWTGGPKSDSLALDQHLKPLLKNSEVQFLNYSNRLYFLTPLFTGSRQILRAQYRKPTIVIAVDQLFWQLYGRFPSSEKRLATFQGALEQLNSITCPLVIGNIPDASKAVRLMLSESQVPKIETINKANKILTAWVENRQKNKQQTAIVDLSHFMQLCVANEEIQVNGIKYPAGTTKGFLQRDMLHPTTLGITAISHAVIHAIKSLGETKSKP